MSSTGVVTPQLDLSFRHHPGRGTWLDRRLFRWPFTVSRGFRLDTAPAGMLTLILQTVSGAIQAEDALLQRIAVEAGAAAHVTTQGASMVYRAPTGLSASDAVELNVGAEGILEYLPEPRILFPDADLSQSLRLTVAASSIAVLSDGFVLHDPAGQGRPFRRYVSDIELVRTDGNVMARDRAVLDGPPQRRGRRAQFAAHGSLLVIAPLPSAVLTTLCGEIAARLGAIPTVYAAAAPLPQDCGVVVRVAAPDGRHLRLGLAAGWQAARHALFDAAPASRRKDAA